MLKTVNEYTWEKEKNKKNYPLKMIYNFIIIN